VSKELVKVLKMSILCSLLDSLPTSVVRKVIAKCLLDTGIPLTQNELEELERMFKLPEPSKPKFRVHKMEPVEPVKPVEPRFFIHCPLCAKLLATIRERPSDQDRKEMIRKHLPKCVSAWAFREALSQRGDD